jgi:hypothetical protein
MYRNVDIEVPHNFTRSEGSVFLFEFDCLVACTVEGKPGELFVSNIGGIYVDGVNLLEASDVNVRAMALAEAARLFKCKEFEETAIDQVVNPPRRRALAAAE